jgi:hypothetical protein
VAEPAADGVTPMAAVLDTIWEVFQSSMALVGVVSRACRAKIEIGILLHCFLKTGPGFVVLVVVELIQPSGKRDKRRPAGCMRLMKCTGRAVTVLCPWP